MTVEITYYAACRNASMYGQPISSETCTASGTSALSAATPANADIVRLKATANDRYAYGTGSPTATATAGANGHYIASGDVIDLPAVPGWKFAVITAS